MLSCKLKEQYWFSFRYLNRKRTRKTARPFKEPFFPIHGCNISKLQSQLWLCTISWYSGNSVTVINPLFKKLQEFKNYFHLHYILFYNKPVCLCRSEKFSRYSYGRLNSKYSARKPVFKNSAFLLFHSDYFLLMTF